MPHALPRVALPKGWPRRVKSALLHVIALASVAVCYARGKNAESPSARVRTASDYERLQAEFGLLKEQFRLLHARFARVPPRHRPHDTPTERLQILELKAVGGWSNQQTAETFGVSGETIGSWVGRVDDEGPGALVQLREPVNKLPDFVRQIVQKLKVLCPRMGKVRIAMDPRRTRCTSVDGLPTRSHGSSLERGILRVALVRRHESARAVRTGRSWSWWCRIGTARGSFPSSSYGALREDFWWKRLGGAVSAGCRELSVEIAT